MHHIKSVYTLIGCLGVGGTNCTNWYQLADGFDKLHISAQ